MLMQWAVHSVSGVVPYAFQIRLEPGLWVMFALLLSIFSLLIYHKHTPVHIWSLFVVSLLSVCKPSQLTKAASSLYLTQILSIISKCIFLSSIISNFYSLILTSTVY